MHHFCAKRGGMTSAKPLYTFALQDYSRFVPGEYDATEFIDTDFTANKPSFATNAPARDDVDRKVVEAQQKLVELKRAQEELERERAGLEELRRRQNEFQTGRQEILQNLTRGLGLLEEAEFAARREADQMVKTVGDFRTALAKIQAIHDEAWTKENFQIELTRALTTLENARMEWNSARLKLPALAGESRPAAVEKNSPAPAAPSLAELEFGQLCKIGLALTWPLLLVALTALAIFIAILARK
jgi:chromosome segregation ATPase